MRVEEKKCQVMIADDEKKVNRSADQIMEEAQKDLEGEKEKKLIEFLTRLVVKATLKEFYEQKY